jgi:hypothetical protein
VHCYTQRALSQYPPPPHTRRATHRDKILERRVVVHLVHDAVLGLGIVGDVVHVGLAPVERGVEHGGRDRVHDRVLIALRRVQPLEQPLVVCVQLRKVIVRLGDECAHALARDDWRVRVQQRLDVHLRGPSASAAKLSQAENGGSTHDVDVFEVLDVLHLALDQLKDDAAPASAQPKPNQHPPPQKKKSQHALLPLLLLLRDVDERIGRHELVPLELADGALAHRVLPCLQLTHNL